MRRKLLGWLHDGREVYEDSSPEMKAALDLGIGTRSDARGDGQGQKSAGSRRENKQNDDLDPTEFAITTLADVTSERVSWLWPGRLPCGKLVTLDGDPGLGKSTLALAFSAMISTGGIWPDGTRCDYPGDVILLSAEDGLADTIRPRLDAAGADVKHIHAVKGVPLTGNPDDGLRMPTLADIDMLLRLIKRTGARLVVIDVLMAYLPTGTDSHRDQDIRQVLARLAALAESTGCTILLLRHLNKGKGDPMYRGGGSIGIIGASRVGLLVASDPDDESLRVLATLKNNLAPAAPSLAYRLVPDDLLDVARVQWAGVSEHGARALLADDGLTDEGTGAEARMWLSDYLMEQGRVRSRDVKADAMKEGFSKASIDRAASKLRLVFESEGFPRVTYWSLPKTQLHHPPSTDATDATEATGADQQERRDPREATGEQPHHQSSQSSQLHQSPHAGEPEATGESTEPPLCDVCDTELITPASITRGQCAECTLTANMPPPGAPTQNTPGMTDLIQQIVAKHNSHPTGTDD